MQTFGGPWTLLKLKILGKWGLGYLLLALVEKKSTGHKSFSPDFKWFIELIPEPPVGESPCLLFVTDTSFITRIINACYNYI